MGHWFADPQNVYWLTSALSTNICLWIISSCNIYKCTDFVQISEVWIERTYTPPSYMCMFVGGCTVKQAMYCCYHRLISWRATFRYFQMCWLLSMCVKSRKERIVLLYLSFICASWINVVCSVYCSMYANGNALEQIFKILFRVWEILRLFNSKVEQHIVWEMAP